MNKYENNFPYKLQRYNNFHDFDEENSCAAPYSSFTPRPLDVCLIKNSAVNSKAVKNYCLGKEEVERGREFQPHDRIRGKNYKKDPSFASGNDTPGAICFQEEPITQQATSSFIQRYFSSFISRDVFFMAEKDGN